MDLEAFDALVIGGIDRTPKRLSDRAVLLHDLLELAEDFAAGIGLPPRRFFLTIGRRSFSARRRAVRLNMCGIDHLGVRRSTIAGKLSEQVFPYAATGPAHEAVIDRGWRTIGLRTIAPSAAALEHVHDPADASRQILARSSLMARPSRCTATEVMP
jgi:hypothetical protein